MFRCGVQQHAQGSGLLTEEPPREVPGNPTTSSMEIATGSTAESLDTKCVLLQKELAVAEHQRLVYQYGASAGVWEYGPATALVTWPNIQTAVQEDRTSRLN